MESAQVVQEVFFKDAETAQVVDVVGSKMQVADVFNNLFQSGCDRVAAVTGIVAVKSVKYNDLIRGVLEITLHHS